MLFVFLLCTAAMRAGEVACTQNELSILDTMLARFVLFEMNLETPDTTFRIQTCSFDLKSSFNRVITTEVVFNDNQLCKYVVSCIQAAGTPPSRVGFINGDALSENRDCRPWSKQEEDGEYPFLPELKLERHEELPPHFYEKVDVEKQGPITGATAIIKGFLADEKEQLDAVTLEREKSIIDQLTELVEERETYTVVDDHEEEGHELRQKPNAAFDKFGDDYLELEAEALNALNELSTGIHVDEKGQIFANGEPLKVPESSSNLAKENGEAEKDKFLEMLTQTGEFKPRTVEEKTEAVEELKTLVAKHKIGDEAVKSAALSLGQNTVGGWQGCDSSMVQSYIDTALVQLRLHSFETLDTTVLSCVMQVVAGVKVRLSVGADEEHECHFHIFYPPNADLEPEVEIRRQGCIEGRDEPILQTAIKEVECTQFTANRALAFFKSNHSGKLANAYKENVLGCHERYIRGNNIELSLQFNGKMCSFKMFVTEKNVEKIVGTDSCSA